MAASAGPRQVQGSGMFCLVDSSGPSRAAFSARPSSKSFPSSSSPLLISVAISSSLAGKRGIGAVGCQCWTAGAQRGGRATGAALRAGGVLVGGSAGCGAARPPTRGRADEGFAPALRDRVAAAATGLERGRAGGSSAVRAAACGRAAARIVARRCWLPELGAVLGRAAGPAMVPGGRREAGESARRLGLLDAGTVG